MDQTSNLQLPYIMPAQAQKHVTHNEALRGLDAIVQLAVLDRDLISPPVTNAEGDRHIIAAGATGDWSGRDLNIAAYQDGAWAFFTPNEGWLAWVSDEDVLLAWDGTQWSVVVENGVNPVAMVGINATADTYNRLSINADASLFNHNGNGHQLKLNKSAPSETGSIVFQTGFSARAEFGLTGDDDWHVKVSPDGSTWYDSIVVDRNNGSAAFEHPPALPSYTVATLPSAVTYGAGSMVFVSDESGGAVPAFSDGTDWRRTTDRTIVS